MGPRELSSRAKLGGVALDRDYDRKRWPNVNRRLIMKMKMVALLSTAVLVGWCTSTMAQDQTKAKPFDQIQDSAPRSPFDKIQDSAPKIDPKGDGGVVGSATAAAPFDSIRDAAPRSPFDKLQDSAPRAPFDQIQDSAPKSATPAPQSK